jgi:hypothetical protein
VVGVAVDVPPERLDGSSAKVWIRPYDLSYCDATDTRVDH